MQDKGRHSRRFMRWIMVAPTRCGDAIEPSVGQRSLAHKGIQGDKEFGCSQSCPWPTVGQQYIRVAARTGFGKARADDLGSSGAPQFAPAHRTSG